MTPTVIMSAIVFISGTLFGLSLALLSNEQIELLLFSNCSKKKKKENALVSRNSYILEQTFADS